MKNKKRFILIELLIVVAILTILSGMVCGNLKSKEISDKTRAIKIVNDLRTIEKAF